MVASCVAGVEVTEVTVGEGIGRGSGNEWLGDERVSDVAARELLT